MSSNILRSPEQRPNTSVNPVTSPPMVDEVEQSLSVLTSAEFRHLQQACDHYQFSLEETTNGLLLNMPSALAAHVLEKSQLTAEDPRVLTEIRSYIESRVYPKFVEHSKALREIDMMFFPEHITYDPACQDPEIFAQAVLQLPQLATLFGSAQYPETQGLMLQKLRSTSHANWLHLHEDECAKLQIVEQVPAPAWNDSLDMLRTFDGFHVYMKAFIDTALATKEYPGESDYRQERLKARIEQRIRELYPLFIAQIPEVQEDMVEEVPVVEVVLETPAAAEVAEVAAAEEEAIGTEIVPEETVPETSSSAMPSQTPIISAAPVSSPKDMPAPAPATEVLPVTAPPSPAVQSETVSENVSIEPVPSPLEDVEVDSVLASEVADEVYFEMHTELPGDSPSDHPGEDAPPPLTPDEAESAVTEEIPSLEQKEQDAHPETLPEREVLEPLIPVLPENENEDQDEKVEMEMEVKVEHVELEEVVTVVELPIGPAPLEAKAPGVEQHTSLETPLEDSSEVVFSIEEVSNDYIDMLLHDAEDFSQEALPLADDPFQEEVLLEEEAEEEDEEDEEDIEPAALLDEHPEIREEALEQLLPVLDRVLMEGESLPAVEVLLPRLLTVEVDIPVGSTPSLTPVEVRQHFSDEEIFFLLDLVTLLTTQEFCSLRLFVQICYRYVRLYAPHSFVHHSYLAPQHGDLPLLQGRVLFLRFVAAFQELPQEQLYLMQSLYVSSESALHLSFHGQLDQEYVLSLPCS